jgi:hypothetical protein
LTNKLSPNKSLLEKNSNKGEEQKEVNSASSVEIISLNCINQLNHIAMKKAFYLLCISFILLSCGSDDNEPKAKYEFSAYLIDEISILEHAYDEDGSSFEIGWLFDSEDGGKVVSLGGLFPEAGTYTVTLWDAETQAVLAQVDVVAEAGELSMEKIDAVTIVAGKDYVVSFNTFSNRDYYWLSPGVSIYPVELDGITVHGEVETGTSSADSEFPGTDTNTTVVGVPEIGFIKN